MSLQRHHWLQAWLVLVCSAIVFHAQAAQAPPRVVLVPVANMYSGPRMDADVVSQAILGSNVSILQIDGNWARVQTPDQYIGWMRTGDLGEADRPEGYANSGPSAQVQNLFASLYRETDVTQHQPMITVPFETRLEVVQQGTGDDRDWLRIRLPDRRFAWVQVGDVDLHPRLLTIPESIALARRFLGLPYLWGGRSSFGYDCSGFTQMLVRSRGISMPRDADQQAAWDGVIAVDRKDLKPGDLLFFGSGPDKITHTAMYIGAGEFIHDTTHDHPVIQISRLDDEPWTRILVACRRIK
jgi:cell wall-associated NlpC family hydrolase